MKKTEPEKFLAEVMSGSYWPDDIPRLVNMVKRLRETMSLICKDSCPKNGGSEKECADCLNREALDYDGR